jgi:hypothetical protein
MVPAVRPGLLALSVSIVACGGAAATVASPEGAKEPGRPDPAFREYAATHGIRTLNGGAQGGSSEPTAPSLRLERVGNDKPVKLDGLLLEWPALAKASVAIKGLDKIAMNVALQYDDAKLYVGAEVTDASFRAGRDHVMLIIAVPEPNGYAAYEVELYAGSSGESEGSVRFVGRGLVPGAKIVEAPTAGGYTLEASIPLGALTELRVTRVGVRGVARYVHVDTVVATGPGDAQHPAAMPWLPSESELSLVEQLLEPKGLTNTVPIVDRVADLTGDGIRERVAVFGPYLTICGSSFLAGSGFFFRELGGELVSLELRDVSGRGRPDVVVRRRATVGDSEREYLEVLTALGANEEPRVTFAHEIAVRRSDRRIDNAVHLGHGEIEVAVEPATQWDALSYREPIANDVAPILFPWGPVRSQTWRWDGSLFSKSKEASQRESLSIGEPSRTSGADKAPMLRHPAEPPTPKVTRGGDLSERVLEAYRRDRGVDPNAEPKADLKVQLAGDRRPERLLVLGRDLVVFGPGFKGGTGYVYATLSQFASEGEIKDVSARDLTGDGAADIIVRGERRPSADDPNAVSEVMFIYTVRDEAIERVFGIETARSEGEKRVQGLVQFIPTPGGRSFDLLAAPGRATGWTEKTYPWTQQAPGASDIEPILLPWGDVPSVRYVWNGSRFAHGSD